MSTDSSLRFGPFTLDRERRVLWREDELVSLQLLPTRVLLYLAERPGQVVTRDELREEIWDRVYLGFDDRLNTSVAAIRKALGDSATAPRYVETLRGRGYRFVAEVTGAADVVETAPPRPGRALRVGLGAALVGVVASTALVAALASPPPDQPGTSPTALEAKADPAAWELFVRASALSRTGRRTDLMMAGELLEKAVQRDPGFTRAHAARTAVNARLYLEVGDTRRRQVAMEALHTTHALAPGSPESIWGRGMTALYAERSYVEAATLLDEVGRAWPGDPTVLNARAEAARRLGDWKASSGYFAAALEIDPFNAIAAAGLAVNHHRARDFEAADRYYALATALAPHRPGLVMQRAVLHLRHGAGPDRALAIIRDRAADTRLPPEYAVHMRPDLARLLGPMTRWREADSLRVGPADRGLFNLNRGWLARREGREAEARELFRRAVIYFGGDPAVPPDPSRGILGRPAWLGLAWAWLGEAEAARAHAERQLRNNPLDGDAVLAPHVRKIVADTYAALGDTRIALSLAAELLQAPAAITQQQLLLDPVWAPVLDESGFRELLEATR